MAKTDNLKYFGITKPVLSHEEAQKNGSLGGKKSGEKKREMKKFKEYLEIALQRVVKDRDGNEHTYKEVGAIKLAEKYVQGDLKAQELVLKLSGEMPSDKTEITGANGVPFVAPVLNILPVKPKDD